MPKGTIMGGYGGGRMSAHKTDRFKWVTWCLPDGDRTYVQIATEEKGKNKTKPKVGTLYSLIKPLEKAAAQKTFIIDPTHSSLTVGTFARPKTIYFSSLPTS